MGDFTVEVNFSSFCELCEVKSIINQSNCYKNPTNPSCIDLFLTNSPNSFQKSTVVKTSLSDCYKLIFTVMKLYSPKRTPNKSLIENTLILTKTNLLIKFLSIDQY